MRPFGLFVTSEVKRAASRSPGAGSRCSGLAPDHSQLLFDFLTPAFVYVQTFGLFRLLSYHKGDVLIVSFVCLICGGFFLFK